MDAFIPSIISVIAISLVSLVGILTISIKAKKLDQFLFVLISLAAGTLIGDVFLHIIPELDEAGHDNPVIYMSIIAGILFFFSLESILKWHHHHGATHERESIGINNLLADGLHNFVDGIVIGAAYLTSFELGVATTIAVLLHEIPQEIGDFGVLLHAGFSKAKALIFNLLSALLSVLGLVLMFVFQNTVLGVTDLIVAFAAGGFIYIAIADLLPELSKEVNIRKKLAQLLILILGIMLMFGLTLFEPPHSDEEDHNESSVLATVDKL